MRDVREIVFPPDLFPRPKMVEDKDGKLVSDWHWLEEPLSKKLTELSMQDSEYFRKAMGNNLTEEFITTLYYKITRAPPENITLEIKGATRSGKSTVAIFLANLISRWWQREFTVDNIFANQSDFLEAIRQKKLGYGDTGIIDEQRSELWGEGSLREAEQLQDVINICAKKCINMIFIYPPNFSMRNSPYGLETVAKDTDNKHIKCFYYDLRRREMVFGGTWAKGYVIIPKYQNRLYQELPQSQWSEFRIQNFHERHYDFDSLLEENYEIKKNKWIDTTLALESGLRNRTKEDVAHELAADADFLALKRNGEREAYIQLMVNEHKIPEMTKSEYRVVMNMAIVLSKKKTKTLDVIEEDSELEDEVEDKGSA